MTILTRRAALVGLAAATIGSAAGAANRPVTLGELRAAFESRDISTRQMVQQSLQGSGYYAGSIDGAWGAQTEEAYRRLMASARYQRHAPHWTWSHEAQVIDTLFFTTSDAFP